MDNNKIDNYLSFLFYERLMEVCQLIDRLSYFLKEDDLMDDYWNKKTWEELKNLANDSTKCVNRDSHPISIGLYLAKIADTYRGMFAWMPDELALLYFKSSELRRIFDQIRNKLLDLEKTADDLYHYASYKDYCSVHSVLGDIIFHGKKACLQERETCFFWDDFDLSNISSAIVPEKQGVYVFHNHYSPLYIGKTVNLKQRLNQHHRIAQLKAIGKLGITISLFFLEIEEADEEALSFDEKKWIEQIKPSLNGAPVSEEFLNTPPQDIDYSLNRELHSVVQGNVEIEKVEKHYSVLRRCVELIKKYNANKPQEEKISITSRALYDVTGKRTPIISDFMQSDEGDKIRRYNEEHGFGQKQNQGKDIKALICDYVN